MKYNNEKGFTLIEILISLLILAILAIAFVSLFSGSHVNVVNSGRRENAVYESQTAAELLINGSSDETLEQNSVLDITSSSDSLTITFANAGEDIICTVDGTYKTIEAEVSESTSNETVTLKLFIPN